MYDAAFSALYEDVSYSLHMLTQILKSLHCVNENAETINETIDTLISLALAQVEVSRTHLLQLHHHQYAKEPDTEKAEA